MTGQRAQSLQAVLEGYRAYFGTLSISDPTISDIWAKGMTDFEALNASEKRRFFYLIVENAFNTQNAMQLYNNGLCDRVDYDAWLHYTATVIKTPGGQQAWAYLESTITPTVRKVVDDYLAANPDLISYIDLNPFFKVDLPEQNTLRA